ncbi:UNVERIFIED_CONTAM: AP-3 complex subunit delta-1 [Siphonaria sp. JEL0065]|nr:AP-3 complex subunit delta-1 [Siphonaria sp. JEL0065]
MASFFQKSLHDLIRGIRAHASDEDRYIRSCLDEIRQEVKKTDLDVKAVAVAKLFYLHMLGFDMGWAAFHVIEVMSSSVFTHKRIGYIAAAISFRQDTNVLMLCTNLIKKDLNSNKYLETALALNGLCTIVTPDLGRDLSPDLIAMMNHSRPYIRKRVILCLYKVFLKYPEALRVAYSSLKMRLEDSDPSVVSAAVNVVCELARKNPKSYLPLAPQLFTILTTSTNNWLLIKIVKLFGALCPLEPRLIKKLIPPITNLIQTTSAMSLAYECILTAILGGMITPESSEAASIVDGANATLGKPSGTAGDAIETVLTKACVRKLKSFITENDQNLKYLGLFALCKLLPLRPHAVGEHRAIILECLEDKDTSIRMRALELVSAMITKKSVMVIVTHLLKQIDPSTSAAAAVERDEHHQPTNSSLTIASDSGYAEQVIHRILDVCSKDTYAIVIDYEWYISVLIACVRIRGVGKIGERVAEQLMDLCVRVPDLRAFAVDVLMELILDDSFLASTAWEKNNTDVLYAAAWIVGEYSSHVSNPKELISHLIHTKITALPSTAQSTYVQAALKIYAAWISGTTKKPNADDLLVLEDPEAERKTAHVGKDEFEEVTDLLIEGMSSLCGSIDLEVQERASSSLQILGLIKDLTADEPANETADWAVPINALDLCALFAGELNPVGAQSQALLPVPEGLDLDAWIHDPEPDLVSGGSILEDQVDEPFGYGQDEEEEEESFVSTKKKETAVSKSREERVGLANAEKRKNDPYYLGGVKDGEEEVVAKPKKKVVKVVKKPVPTAPQAPPKRDLFSLASKPRTQYTINRNDELPAGVVSAKTARKGKEEVDADTLAVRSIDLTAPVVTTAGTNRLGWEVGRATLLTEAAPQLDNNVDVVRKFKKVVKVKKGSITSPAAAPGTPDAEKKKKIVFVKKAPAAGSSPNPASVEDTPLTPNKESSIISETSNLELLPDINTEALRNIATSNYESQEPQEIAAMPTFRTCVENDNIVFGFDWYSRGLVSPHTVSLSVCLVIFNKSEQDEMKGLNFTIAPHPLAVVSSLDGGNVLTLQNADGIIPAQGFGKILMNIVIHRGENEPLAPHFIEGACTVEIDEPKLYPFTIQLPSTINLIPDLRIAPATFAETLANQTSFPHSSAFQFPVASAEDFSEVVKTLASRLRLSVVEEVPLAATVYGKSVCGDGIHVAGVIKARLKAKAGNSMLKAAASASVSGGGIISVELKSGDAGLIDVLIEEVNEFSSTL